MSVRSKRLQNDFQALSELVYNSGGTLKIISLEGNPPYKYLIQYRCKGIQEFKNRIPILRNLHQVEFLLGNNYPRKEPDVRFVTPIFHPNIYPSNRVCLGNYWSIMETLPELVLRVGKFIQYSKDVLNLNSPANSEAKKWAARNMKDFPLDNQTFTSELIREIVWDDT
ncbi:MAG: ubiquitin-conjugating enzyme E2 [Prochloraceae cyanobacterium]|nr:ubiquitin-conjugating enzyme E2 [Prochloraceae cyanobacterium]